MKICKRILLTLLLAMPGLLLATQAPFDLRVVVDVSQPMINYSANRPTHHFIDYFISHVPKSSVAGIWTYSRFVNMLMPLGDVNPTWRQQAQQKIKSIKYLGHYQNVIKALEKSTVYWHKKPSNTQRILVLLSSGKFNLGEGPAVNEELANYLINAELPLLKEKGVVAHIVDMSPAKGSEFLRQVANAIGGQYYRQKDLPKLEQNLDNIFNSIQAHPLTKENSNQLKKKSSNLLKKNILEKENIKKNYHLPLNEVKNKNNDTPKVQPATFIVAPLAPMAASRQKPLLKDSQSITEKITPHSQDNRTATQTASTTTANTSVLKTTKEPDVFKGLLFQTVKNQKILKSTAQANHLQEKSSSHKATHPLLLVNIFSKAIMQYGQWLLILLLNFIIIFSAGFFVWRSWVLKNKARGCAQWFEGTLS